MQYKITKHIDDFKDYIDKLAELEAQNWSLDPDTFKAYAEWNYFDRPASNPPILYLARDQEEIIAMRVLYETEWQFGGKPDEGFKALGAADLLIKKEYRNKGLYNLIMGHIIDDVNKSGYAYLLNFNASPINMIGSISKGWKSVGKIDSIYKQLERPESVVVKYSKTILRKAGIYNLVRDGILKISKGFNNTQRIDTIIKEPSNSGNYKIVLDSKPRHKEMSELIETIPDSKKIRLKRNDLFFQWRYRNPLSKYIFLYCYDKNLSGYLVLQIHRSREFAGEFNIIEFEGSDSQVKLALLEYMLQVVNSGSISVWETMLDRDSYDFMLSEGFKKAVSKKSVTDFTQTILVKPLGANGFEYSGYNLLDPEMWELKMLYLHDS